MNLPPVWRSVTDGAQSARRPVVKDDLGGGGLIGCKSDLLFVEGSLMQDAIRFRSDGSFVQLLRNGSGGIGLVKTC